MAEQRSQDVERELAKAAGRILSLGERLEAATTEIDRLRAELAKAAHDAGRCAAVEEDRDAYVVESERLRAEVMLLGARIKTAFCEGYGSGYFDAAFGIEGAATARQEYHWHESSSRELLKKGGG
jgi:hypothetical protein